MQFDVIITNPPFQDALKRNKTPHKLWIDFTLTMFSNLLKEGGSYIQVSPSSFSSPSNKVLKLMSAYLTKYIRFDTEHHFPDVASTFSDYWIQKVKKTNQKTKVSANKETFSLDLTEKVLYLPNDLCRISLNIHKKTMFNPTKKLKIEWDYVTAHNIRRYDNNPSLSEVKTRRHKYPVFHTNKSVWWSSVRQDWANSKKVMWTRSGYTKPFFDDGKMGGTDMVYYVKVKSNRSGETLCHNLNLNLFTYIFKSARWSGYGNDKVFTNLPDFQSDKKFTNKELYQLFNLTDEEVKYIEESLASGKSENGRT